MDGLKNYTWIRPDAAEARGFADTNDTQKLCQKAAAIRDGGYGDIITVSRKVFIPLTMLCRDVCHYCTFAKAPRGVHSPYMTEEQVMEIAHAGRLAGCDEALFTLGDKPELRYRAAREALDEMGFASTTEYLKHMAGRVLKETGLLPHINAGVMSEDEILALRAVSASQGIMLESASERLCSRGMPHHGSPDKIPAVRLAMIEAAGRAKVPFTSGILIGIGETRLERIEALLCLRELNDKYGHIQELIVQNFRAKPGTKMANAAEPSIDEHRWTIAVARLIFGPSMSIQAPPNLRPDEVSALVCSGLNDWGGVSPVTADHVNPEAPWPSLQRLAKQTAETGKVLSPRLAVYPSHANGNWLEDEVLTQVYRRSDANGLAHETTWRVGATSGEISLQTPSLAPSHEITRVIDTGAKGQGLNESDMVRLFNSRGGQAEDIFAAADQLRKDVNGDTVSYVVTRNINYTNICSYSCSFCAFSKGSTHADLRGKPYDLKMEEIVRRAREAWERGATEVCMQGGIHPDFSGNTYLEICKTLKAEIPSIHIHAFSPLEISQGAESLGLPVGEFLLRLKDAGLGTLPGTAAEILVDRTRNKLCPDKLDSTRWLEVIAAAHKTGFKTTATIMFGHVDSYSDWALHLNKLRSLQNETGGFTEFVPLPFVHMEAPLYRRGLCRQGPSLREALLMHAVARIALHGSIENIQTSWVKMGPQSVQRVLNAGVNDLGGTLMNESISRAAGTNHGQECSPASMDEMIAIAGRTPRQRTTLYGEASKLQVQRSYENKPISEVIQNPVLKKARIGSKSDIRLSSVPGE